MATPLHALDTSRVLNHIKSCSKQELLSCLSTLNTADLKQLVFSSVKQSKPQTIPLIENIWNDQPQTTNLFERIRTCFKIKNKVKKQNRNNPFTSLPVSIGAYILSFATMKERINNELISNDLYSFAQIPNAKYHLIIDQNFCKALYYDTIDIQKYFNTQFLEITYLFKDGQYEQFEGKYYTSLAKIISKSPLLHTIKYKLKYKTAKTKISSKCIVEPYYATDAHILQWIQSILNKSDTNNNIFDSVTKLIWVPSQLQTSVRNVSFWRNRFTHFCHFLPNLTSFVLPQSRSYVPLRSQYTPAHDDTDCLWEVFKNNYYRNRFHHIECNMDVCRINHIYWQTFRNIKIINNPLSHFHKFINLQSLKLILPIFTNCQYYYASLKISQNAERCMHLTDISLTFVNSEVTRFEGDDVLTHSCENTIDHICQYILSSAPNIRKYTLVTNGLSNGELIHLMGFYDRLEYLCTDSLTIIQREIRMISLKQLTVQLYENERLSNDLKLHRFPNLESFKCMYVNRVKSKWSDLNGNINDFIIFLTKQTNNKDLKYVSICHRNAKRKERRKRIRTEYFNLTKCSKNNSLELCKAIIALTTTNNNFKIKSVEFSPIALKSKEIEYLHFWCGNKENGSCEANNYINKAGTFLTDLYCAQ